MGKGLGKGWGKELGKGLGKGVGEGVWGRGRGRGWGRGWGRVGEGLDFQISKTPLDNKPLTIRREAKSVSVKSVCNSYAKHGKGLLLAASLMIRTSSRDL